MDGLLSRENAVVDEDDRRQRRDGVCHLPAPVASNGESHFFTFATLDAELSQQCANIGYGAWSAFKIPADPAQFEMTLQIDTRKLTTQVLQGNWNLRAMI
jgi:hypothetical protein